ncbi:oligosaccharide flippase family protein [Erysipelatoclostridium sp. An173]|uniref:oligosaccharide flippase family protein n=1 Tax=Erysipelatoclostridium sp. An173 TaxID=1965571 RepID=UPI0032083194
MSSSIKKNFLYNAFYNVLTLILPLITTPYISRVMGAERIGIYSYAYSVAYYFGLFILLGLNNYGNRTIAGVREDKEQLSKAFWSIYAMQIMMTIIIIIVYIGYVLFFAENKLMAWIQIIYLISVAFDINWFFYGMEQFKMTVTRNSIIKILNLILILLLVKGQNDLYIYAIIMVTGMLVSQLALWMFLKRFIILVKIEITDVLQHIKPNLVLFIPVLAISLYTTMSKIILGALSTMEAVGFYENSNKLTQIPSMAITSLGTVMLPRMSNLVANGKHNEATKYIQKSLIVSVFLSCAMAFGICAVSKKFVPIFYGEGYDPCVEIISILVLSSIFISWANVIRTQYLIPNKQDKIYIISVFLGAGINIVTNLILIPYLDALGAAIATFFAELSVCAYQTYRVRKEIKVIKYMLQCTPFLISGIVMYILVSLIPFVTNNLITLCIKVITGAIIYLTMIGIYYKLGLKKTINS